MSGLSELKKQGALVLKCEASYVVVLNLGTHERNGYSWYHNYKPDCQFH